MVNLHYLLINLLGSGIAKTYFIVGYHDSKQKLGYILRVMELCCVELRWQLEVATCQKSISSFRRYRQSWDMLNSTVEHDSSMIESRYWMRYLITAAGTTVLERKPHCMFHLHHAQCTPGRSVAGSWPDMHHRVSFCSSQAIPAVVWKCSGYFGGSSHIYIDDHGRVYLRGGCMKSLEMTRSQSPVAAR